jgi:hypothetical protein
LKTEHIIETWTRLCCPHVQNMHFSADIFLLTLRKLWISIFQYFHIYTVRVKEVRVLFIGGSWMTLYLVVWTIDCFHWNLVSLDHWNIQGIETILYVWEEVSYYPKNVFENPQSSLWCLFLQSQCKRCSTTINNKDKKYNQPVRLKRTTFITGGNQ